MCALQGKRRDRESHAVCLFYCLMNTAQNRAAFLPFWAGKAQKTAQEGPTQIFSFYGFLQHFNIRRKFKNFRLRNCF